MMNRREFCFALGAATALTGIPPARAATKPTARPVPDLLGQTAFHTTVEEDILLDIARRNGLGFTEMMAANPGVDPWVPGPGVRLVIPTGHLLPRAPRQGLVLNLADQRIYFFPSDGGVAESMPVGIGRQGWKTPLGRTAVTRKKADPTWYVPDSIRNEQPDMPRVVPPGPDNPLGRFALYLGWPAYLIHGTNQPWGVGRRVSHGCVRLYPEDIEQLFAKVAIGTPVTVVDQAAKIGWAGDELLLELHPSQAQSDRIERGAGFARESVPELAYLLIEAAGNQASRLDWAKIETMVRQRRGIPEPVLLSGARRSPAQTSRTDG